MGDTTKETGSENITPEIQDKLEKLTKLESENEELRTKHENLNQGIAKYRDEANKSAEKTKELEEKLQLLEDRLNKGSDIEISEEDESIFEKIARKKGVITREEFERIEAQKLAKNQQDIQKQAVDEFLKKHPEYDNDNIWPKVQEEFGLYRTPTTLDGYRKILNKIHKDFSSSDSEKKGGDKKLAELITKSRLSLGGGSQGSSSEEEELEKLSKKYPRLSKEQIKGQLEEINALEARTQE